jgi:hypothetical protein
MNVRRLATAAALVLILAGCGSTHSASRSTGLTFRNDFLVFGYPPGWKPTVPQITRALHFDPMVYVSSQPVRPPCRTRGSVTACGWPLDRLRRGGALLVWENRGAPGWSLRTAAGAPVRVGGRKAKRAVDRPGACAAIGADETIQVAIARPLPENWTAFTACLKGPGLAAGEREVDAVLASTHFLQP